MPDQPDNDTTTPDASQESKASEYMRGGKGRKDDVRGSRIYPASSPDAPAGAEVRSPGDFVGHSKPPHDEIMAELVHEHSAHVRTPEGLRYGVRVMAEPEANGMWIGWLAFHPLDHGAPVLRTDRDTSQASREAVVTWALGLERAYFEGAFARAHLS